MARQLGIFIKEKREELELSREDLAQRVGASVSAIMSWEAGRYRPTRHAESLAEALGVSVDDLNNAGKPYVRKHNGNGGSNGHHPAESEVVITPPITGNIQRAKFRILENTAVIRGMLQVARLVGDERTVEVTKMVEEKIVNIEEEARGLDE